MFVKYFGMDFREQREADEKLKSSRDRPCGILNHGLSTQVGEAPEGLSAMQACIRRFAYVQSDEELDDIGRGGCPGDDESWLH